MKRLAILGASNARRCLPTIASVARNGADGPVQLFGAFGHGRSYGATSSVFGRSLAGILQSGIWRALEATEGPVSNAAMVDIGNDILYGFSVSEILGWVGECISRLERLGAGITVMGLPVATIRLRSSREAWSEILGAGNAVRRLPPITAFRVRLGRPAWESFLGIERRHLQPALHLNDGSEISLY